MHAGSVRAGTLSAIRRQSKLPFRRQDNMNNPRYRAVLEASDDGFNVFFPDFDGCISWGATLDQAALHAADALALFLDDWTGPLPPPSAINDPTNPEAEPAAVILVSYRPELAAA